MLRRMDVWRGVVAVVLLAGFLGLRDAPRLPTLDDERAPLGPMAVTTDVPRSVPELRARIAEVLRRDHLPGVAIALVGRDGPIWVGGVGVRNLTTGAPMQAETTFRVGSLSKSIVALGVMRLVDQGKLDLNQPLREILPDVGIDNPWEAVTPVTLAQCMEHTAGFDDVRFNEVFSEDEALPVRDALALNPRSRVVRWPPGTRHAYSNVGYSLAARAIEVVTGEPFDAYLRREILAPMGIADADFRRTPLLAERLATGYFTEDTVARFFPFAHRASGALLASADDLAKLVQFWLRRGDGYPPIVSREGLARIERSGTLPYPHLTSDYGFANYGDLDHPVLGRGHDGGMPGFNASFRYFPALGVGYGMLLNATYQYRGYGQIRSLLYAYLTQGQPVAAPAKPSNPEPPGAGFFAYASPRNEVFAFLDRALIGWHVAASDDRVTVAFLSGGSFYLLPTPDGAYRRPTECGSSVVFTTAANGTRLMVTSFDYAEEASSWVATLRYGALGVAMVLLRFAPLFAVAALALGIVVRRRLVPTALLVWPAIAGLCTFGFPHVLQHAFLAGSIGGINVLTVGFFGLTVLFALASTISLVETIRWSVRPDRPPLDVRLFPAACAVAGFGLSVWLAAHGLIGLRTWAW